MLNELGHFSLILAFLIALTQALMTLITGTPGPWQALRTPMMSFATPAMIAQWGLVSFAFLILVRAFLLSDFSLEIVAANSHSAKPLLYKFAGTWGNHEGSMLLWILMLTFLGAMVALFAQRLPDSFVSKVLGIQAGIIAIFLSFLLFTSNPFSRLPLPPPDGRGLNPLLQDAGLAFHPPFLYFGYVGFSIAFAFAIAALWEGRVGPGWARWVRPWTLLAWSSLTLGIAMGAWWAYYELGWGGFWFWDPVENASLMPWLAGTALVHSAIVLEKRDSLKVWTILTAIITFSTSLMGTFLVRSGLLTSVHAFANDPLRGQFLLLIFFAITGAALILFAVRAQNLAPGGTFKLISREAAIIANNILLSIILFTVFLGTFWPSFADLIFNRSVSVGPPYFNAVTMPFAFLLTSLMAFGALASWKRARGWALVKKLQTAAGLSLALLLAVGWITRGGPLFALLGAFMGIWTLAGVITDIALRAGIDKAASLSSLWRRLLGLPRSFWGMAAAHTGVGLTILGMTGTALWVEENAAVMQPGDTLSIAQYTLHYDKLEDLQIANYTTRMATFSLQNGDNTIATLTPERRFYPVAGQPTTEAAIIPRYASDIYVALGEQRDNGIVVRAWYHPLVYLMWSGAIIMSLGGLISLSDRRYRAAIPAPSQIRGKSEPRTAGPITPPSKGVPAE